MSRCYKGYFQDGLSAKLGMGRCIGGPVCDNIKWKPCRYLQRCLQGASKKEYDNKSRSG